MKAVAERLEIYAENDTADPVNYQFRLLAGRAVQFATTQEAIEKAKQRKLLGDPPTSPDKHTIGDELIWETLLAQCKDDLIVVTRDRSFLDNYRVLQEEYYGYSFYQNDRRRLIAVTDKLGDALKKDRSSLR